MSPPDPSSPSLSEVYIDESSTQHQYLVLGAVIIDQADVAEFLGALWSARLPELPQGEMKWTKVSRAKLPAYKRLVDLFFRPRYHFGPHFHALVVDATKVNHRVYNKGSREIGFNKEVYQLAMKCGRLYTGLFHVYPDKRETNQRPEDLRLMLNRGIRAKGDTRDWPFRRVQFRDSKKTELLQLADIFAGAIAYRLNRHHEEFSASDAKVALSEHVLKAAGIVDVSRDTHMRGKFTVWHRVLR